MVTSIANAEHYVWGEVCDGWHLLKGAELSIIQERVPPGGAELMHYHSQARQFFYILDGEGTLVFEDKVIHLKRGDGVEIPPGIQHQFKNGSNADVHFLVISFPPTRGDRTNLT